MNRFMAKNAEFCTLTPDFPPEAYMVFLNPIKGARILQPYPMAFIYKSLDEVNEVITQAVQEIQTSNEFNVKQHSLLLPIHFHTLYPMRREFWQSPSHHYDSLDRMRTFQQVATTPELFKLLVTPTYLDENGKWHLNATLPFFQTSDEKLIEQFMFHSDQSVDKRAKFAALYTFGKPTQYNWETQEISVIKTKPLSQKHHN